MDSAIVLRGTAGAAPTWTSVVSLLEVNDGDCGGLMASIRSYRELIVWQKSMDLTVRTYEGYETLSFRGEVWAHFTNAKSGGFCRLQTSRKGRQRRTTGEFLQMLGVARGSLAELETFLDFIGKAGAHSKRSQEIVCLEACAEINKNAGLV